MRTLARMLSAFTILTAGLTAPAHAASGAPLLYDPVFELTFDPHVVRFESAPQSLVQACQISRARPYWLFARVSMEGADYYVVGSHEDDHGYETGLALKVVAGVCQKENSENLFLAKRPVGGYGNDRVQLPGLDDTLAIDAGHKPAQWDLLHSAGEERLYKALVADAIIRAEKAWGGEAPFKARLCTLAQLDLLKDESVLFEQVKPVCAGTSVPPR